MKLRITRGTTRGSVRGTEALSAPEQHCATAANVTPDPEVRQPAPAGAFQRAAQFRAMEREASGDEEPYVPKRGSLAFRLRTAMPKGVAGRLVLSSLALLAVGAGVVMVLAARNHVLHDGRFAIATSSEIEIQGNAHLTREQVLSVFGADLERNIFKVPLAERRADLERLPWVKHATVMRLLPDHLRIALVERVPVAFVRQGTELGLVDAGGVLLDMPADAAGDPQYSFPVLTGLNATDPLSVRAARMAVYAKFMHDLNAGGEKLTQSLSEVDVSNPEDVKAIVTSGGHDVLVHFGDEDFLNRFHIFRQHLPEWLNQYPKLASADMSYGPQVVLEMAPGTGAVTAPGTAAAPAPGTGAPTAPGTAAGPSAAAAVPGNPPSAEAVPATANLTAAKFVKAEKPRTAERGAVKERRAVKAMLARARAASNRAAAPVVHEGQRAE